MTMRALICVMAMAGCAAPGSEALKQAALAEQRSELGDAAGAEQAARRAAALEAEARRRADEHHGWLWHDLAMD
jgi:hypothetical protein